MDNNSSELVKTYIRGENNAIVMLFMDEYEKLKIVSYNILKDKDTADDVLQDVAEALISIPAWKRKVKFRDSDNLLNIIYTRTKTKSIDYLRKQIIRRKNENGILKQYPNNYDKSFLSGIENNDELTEARKVLTHVENEIVKMIIDGYNNDEITTEIKKIFNTDIDIRVEKQRIKRKLKREIIKLRNIK